MHPESDYGRIIGESFRECLDGCAACGLLRKNFPQLSDLSQSRVKIMCPNISMGINLAAVVHIEFNRVGCQSKSLHFFILEFDIAIDYIVSEYATRLEKITVLVECFQCLVK